jgi:anti-anti-sigma factor
LFDRLQLSIPTVTVEGSTTIIWLAGIQDLAVVDQLRVALAQATKSSAAAGRRVVVDLGGVTFIDSATTRTLIDATLTVPEAPHALTLRAPSACVRRMFDLCQRTDLLEAA